MTNFVSQIGKYCSKSCCDLDKRIDPHSRFWPRVQKSDGCWLWTGAVGTDGYGKFWHDGSTRHAHRVAYELTYGPIGNDMLFACHSCDVPLCVRPDHIFLGTPLDNMQDAKAKGRTAQGERHGSRTRPSTKRGSEHPMAKLTEADVLQIRERHAAGHATDAIAASFNVNAAHVRAIAARRIWRHL